MTNLPWRGLFWLALDLYEDDPDFRRSIEPDARELREMRNQLEHKYLKVHDEMWPGEEDTPGVAHDALAFSILRNQLEARTLKMIKLARSALIYLSLGIHAEERRRAAGRPPDAIVPPIFLDVWDDEWKR